MTDVPLPLRARQRAATINDIRRAALSLVAERGFDAVTTEDVAAAAGISLSTLFRHIPSKESLLVEPLLESISGLVDAYDARPHTESAAQALAAAIVDCMTDGNPSSSELDSWLNAIRSAPHLINRITLVNPHDRIRLIQQTAARMHTRDADDIKPALLVQVLLSASEYVFQRWVAGTAPTKVPLPEQVRDALNTVVDSTW